MSATAKKQAHCLKDKLRAEVFSLAESCPIDECNPEDCPMYNFRKLKHPQRLHWLNALSQEELAYLIAYHDICLNARLALKAFAADTP